jgi:hypothetical protein
MGLFSSPSTSTDRLYRPLFDDDDSLAVSFDSSELSSSSSSARFHHVRSTISHIRHRTQAFLSSKWQHYLVLTFVTLDVSSIFADIFIALYMCEEGRHENPHRLDPVREGLSIVSLVFSCLFMLELLASVWAFGWRYFRSKFHCFDSSVIVGGFVIDVALRGITHEVASLVVILRLFRFVKIVDEFSAAAEEQMAAYESRLDDLEADNKKLMAELEGVRGKRDEERQDRSYGQSGS